MLENDREEQTSAFLDKLRAGARSSASTVSYGVLSGELADLLNVRFGQAAEAGDLRGARGGGAGGPEGHLLRVRRERGASGRSLPVVKSVLSRGYDALRGHEATRTEVPLPGHDDLRRGRIEARELKNVASGEFLARASEDEKAAAAVTAKAHAVPRSAP